MVEIQSQYKREPDGSLVPLSRLCRQWAHQYIQADYGSDIGGASQMRAIRDRFFAEHELRGMPMHPLDFTVSYYSLLALAKSYEASGL